MKATFFTLLYVFHLFYNPIDSGATVLDSNSIDEAIKNHEFVFINFYADWCHFSSMLQPIWDEAADLIQEKLGNKVLLGKVDCESGDEICLEDYEGALGRRFSISKYPTLKYIINGETAKLEYRGQRSKEAFLEFVENELKDPVTEMKDLADLAKLDDKKRHVIGYFEDRDQPDYLNFRKAAQALKTYCDFTAGFGETVKQMHPSGQSIVSFRPNYATSNDNDDTFNGDLGDYDALKKWAEGVCVPLVREITFENAEGLTEEGLPFVILFRHPDDDKSTKEYTDAVKTQVSHHKGNVNFLIADGIKFAHPLHHLDKTDEDLPLIVIDSFRHMYVFKDFNNIHTPGKLETFLQDLYSGKLHREYHYGPDQTEEPPAAEEDAEQDNEQPQEDQPSDDDGEGQPSSPPPPPPPKQPVKTDPPPSQFQHLKPSKNRYTVLRDEF